MNRKDRLLLARNLCDRFVQKYAGSVMLGGMYGSTARGRDTQWSDLEMLFIVGDECKAHGQQFIYRGIAVNYTVIRQGVLENMVSNPRLAGDRGWPFWMGVLSVLKVLYGDPAQVATWIAMGRAVPKKKFKQVLERELPGLIIESYGRLLSCKARKNEDDWYCSVLEVLFEMRDALCLLNRSWVTHDYYQGLVDSSQFAVLPHNYRETVSKLWHVKDIDEAIDLTRNLVDAFRHLLAEHGITVTIHTTISDIPA